MPAHACIHACTCVCGGPHVADGGVGGVHQDDLEVLEGGVLVNPVRVQDTQIGALAGNSFFSNRTQGALELELVDTLRSGLSVNLTLTDRSLTAT
jgi:hypothetical protein